MEWKQQPYRAKDTDVPFPDELKKAIAELPAGEEIVLDDAAGNKQILAQARRYIRERDLNLTATTRKGEDNKVFIFAAKPRKKK